MADRPPLGIIPRWRWIELREEELRDAITRYREANVAVPAAWYKELDALEVLADSSTTSFEG